MKVMFRIQTLNGLPKQFPNKLNKAPCTICYTEKITTYPKVTTVDTSKLQPGELVHMEFSFYHVTYIQVLTSVLTVVCANTIILWVFPTEYKRSYVFIIGFMPK